MRRLLAAACACACTIAAASSAWAGDLSSASFTSRGGHVSASGNVGQSEAVGPTGATTTLTSQAGGFWPIAVGAFPTLDFDHDGRQAFLDPDDDNDGLADTVESGTGVFVSASDTGSNPNATDTDGDGFGDLAEVAGGFDPNQFASPGTEIPSLPPLAAAALALALLASATRKLRGETR